MNEFTPQDKGAIKSEIGKLKYKNVGIEDKQNVIQIEKDVKRTFGFRKYFKEENPG